MTTPPTPAAPTPPPVTVSVNTGMPMSLRAASYLMAVLAGLTLGWALYHPKPAPQETPAVAVVQRDSSVILQRAPDAHAKPGMLIPHGGTVERVAKITVQPMPDTTWRPDTDAVADVVDMLGTPPIPHRDSVAVVTCPPVTIDLAIVRNDKDQTRRVIAKATGGVIVGGIDIPVENAAVARTLNWSAGPIYNIGARGWGAAVTHELGPFRILGAATQQRTGGVAYILGLALKF